MNDSILLLYYHNWKGLSECDSETVELLSDFAPNGETGKHLIAAAASWALACVQDAAPKQGGWSSFWVEPLPAMEDIEGCRSVAVRAGPGVRPGGGVCCLLTAQS